MEALGIQPTLLLAQIVNFLVILIALNFILYKPILTVLKKRKQKIEEGLALTEKLKEEEEKLTVQKEKVLAQAREEAKKLFEKSLENAKKEEKEIIKGARGEAEELIEKARKTIEEERQGMIRQIRKDTVDLAVLMTKRLLSRILTPDMQHKVIATHIKDIEKL